MRECDTAELLSNRKMLSNCLHAAAVTLEKDVTCSPTA